MRCGMVDLGMLNADWRIGMWDVRSILYPGEGEGFELESEEE